jgi:hypothetical protein
MVLRAHDAIKAQSEASANRAGWVSDRGRGCGKNSLAAHSRWRRKCRGNISQYVSFYFGATVMWPGTAPRLRVAPQLPRRRPCFLLKPSNPRGDNFVTDEHQVNSIIAAAICEAQKDQPDHQMDPEQAKQIAKCITEALTSAGLQIVPLSND